MERFTKNSDLADFSAHARNKKLKIQLKKIFYIPGKMELSNTKIKKFLAFYQEEAFLIFRETKLRKKILISYQEKAFLIFWETGTPKKLLLFQKTKPCISGNNFRSSKKQA